MSENSKDIQEKLHLIKLKKTYAAKLNSCFDAVDLESRPTDDQEEFFEDIQDVPLRWAVCSNRSGKTSAGGREAAWIFADTHPFLEKPKEWKNKPTLMLILGKKTSQLETELWEGKIKPLLPPGEYKEYRTGNMLQKVVNLRNGNTILFQSHNNPTQARENIQGFTANWVWIDEMPGDASLVSEIIMRITTTNGRFIATFTPLVYNVEVKRMVEQAALPVGKRYFFSIYDNPALADRIDDVIEIIKASCASEDEFECRVNGKWIAPGRRVSCYMDNKHHEIIEDYNPLWRHLVSVDPSASGLTGLTVWAEHPTTGVWYNVISEYLEGDAAFILVEEVEKRLKGLNVTRRVCDPNPAGFYKEAARRKIRYICVGEKANRKADLINVANTMLVVGRMKLTQFSSVLENELVSCSWSESNPDRIVAASSYHTFDTFQYAADALPPFIKDQLIVRSHEQEVLSNWRTQRQEVAKQEKQKLYRIAMKTRRKRGRFSR